MEEVPLARCPTCEGPVPAGGKHRPFCSDRCRLVDLGRWLKEDYSLARPLRPGDLKDIEEAHPPESEETA